MNDFPDDDFAGPTGFGDHFPFYYSIQPWVGVEATTGYSLRSEKGLLHDGVRNRFSPTGARTTGYAAFETENEPSMGWAVARRTQGWADCRSSAVVRLLQLKGTPDDNSLHGCGLCARVSGGTLTDADTVDARNVNVTGYFLVLTWEPTNPRIVLLRLNAGAITVLEDVELASFLIQGQHPLFYAEPLALEMDVIDSGGNPVIACKRLQYPIFGAPLSLSALHTLPGGKHGNQDSQPVWQTVFTHTDTDAGKVTGAGMCGFGGAGVTQLLAPLRASVTVFHSFVAHEQPSTGKWADSFNRADRFADVHVDSTPYMLTDEKRKGRSLMGGWSGGIFGRQDSGSEHWGHNNQSSGTQDDFEVGGTLPGSGQFPGWYLSQRRSSSAAAQHRSADVEFLSAGGGSIAREAGIVLRATWRQEFPSGVFAPQYSADAETQRLAYAAVMHFDGTSTWTLEVRNYTGRSPGSVFPDDVIVMSTEIVAGLSVDTPFEMDFEVQNLDSNTFGQGGLVALRVKINGTVFAPTGAVDGTFIDDDAGGAWIIDTRTGFGGHIAKGSLEGLLFDPASVGTGPLVRFDNWTEETPSNPPTANPSGQASIVIAGETVGAVGTLAIPLSWSSRIRVVQPANRFRMETGHQCAFSRASAARRVWNVRARHRSASERDAFLAFIDDHNGTEIPFTWDIPNSMGGGSITAHFLQTSDEFRRRTKLNRTTFEFDIEEMF